MAVKGADRLYALLPAVYREQDADNGFPLRGPDAHHRRPARPVEQDVAAALGRPLHRDVPGRGSSRTSATWSRTTCSSTGRVAARRPPTRCSPTWPGRTCGRRSRSAPAPTSRRRSTTAAARARCRCWRSWPATSPAGPRTRSNSSSCSAGRSISSTTGPRRAGSTSARSSATSASTAPSTRPATPSTSRPISTVDGWHSIKNVGFFLWRLVPQPAARRRRGRPRAPWALHVQPARATRRRSSRHPRREDDETGLSTELHVPGPIRPRVLRRGPAHAPCTAAAGLHRPLRAARASRLPRRRADDDASLFVISDQTAVLPADVRCRRLDTWPAAQPAGPSSGSTSRRARLALGAGLDETQPRARVHDLRLPGRARRRRLRAAGWLAKRDPGVTEYERRDRRRGAPQFATVAAALAAVAGRRPAERDDPHPRQPHLCAAGRRSRSRASAG